MDTAAITAIIALLGIVLGTLIAPRVNHNLGEQYNRKDLLFKRKLEYFENVLDTIEKNKKTYHQVIGRLENTPDNKEVEKIISGLKKERQNFRIMASPLYFDTRILSEKIIRFVRVEKEIFNRISALENKDKKEFPVLVEQLNNILRMLNKRGSEIISEMKKELAK
jgi:predicted CopG family antitoxin